MIISHSRTVSSSRRAPLLLCAGLAALLAPLPVSAQVSAIAAPTFEPAQGWAVGTTDLASIRGLQGVQLPCVLSNEFDNGFVIRFSGGGERILAMAIDFRQNVFTQGRKYRAVVTLGDGYLKQVEASAFTPNTLIFNLRPHTDFYPSLRASESMSIDIDGNGFNFMLRGAGQSLAALEQCYRTGNAPAIAPVAAPSAPGAFPVPNVAQQPLPQSMDDIIAQSESLTPPMRLVPEGMDIPVQQNAVPAAQNVWSAHAGEEMQAVLKRWADMAGYDLQWQADEGAIIAQDMAVQGEFQEAVSQLLAENAAASGLKSNYQTGANVAQNAPAAPIWVADQGADLRAVLEGWAAQSGVTLVWEGEGRYEVVSPVHRRDSFEAAVASLLDQYKRAENRPLARLNADPRSGARTLIIGAFGS